MSDYMCDCGGKLSLIELQTYEQIVEIKNNGELSKRKRKPYLSHIQLADSYGESSFLGCIECGSKYEFIGLDSKGKVSKGEKFYFEDS
ncbi:hypothetical protein CJ480_15180 [Bacillus subtilis]|uniref:hypothetical protein n=1 Tax=Bacillus subtilis TaxID=1423 RepID=UPI000E76A14A|nr:hypothetical protein [Bacillus subtilis]RJS53061.1 hypothetical protein CJ480_15180 [Bacillus subtilis]